MRCTFKPATPTPKGELLAKLPIRQAYVSIVATEDIAQVVYKVNEEQAIVVTSGELSIWNVQQFCGLYVPFTGELLLGFVQGE